MKKSITLIGLMMMFLASTVHGSTVSSTSKGVESAFLNQAFDGETQLILAARYGQNNIVTTLLDNGSDINGRDMFGNTALIAAAGEGRTKTVKLLLSRNANPTLQTKNGSTALMLAAIGNHLRVVSELLITKADVNLKRNDGETALFIAVKKGYFDVSKRLLNAGADTNLQNTNENYLDSSGFTPLMYAAKKGHTALIRLLLKHKANPHLLTANGDNALSIATQAGHTKIVKLLHKEKSQNELIYTNLTPVDAIIEASKRGNSYKLKQLLKADVSANSRSSYGVTPLLAATYNQHLDIIKTLINNGADINHVPWGTRSQHLTSAAVPFNDMPLLELVYNGDTALTTSIRLKHPKTTSLLLQLGADYNQPNHHHETAALVAATTGNASAMRKLLKHGLDPNIQTIPQPADGYIRSTLPTENGSPLIAAILNDQLPLVELLIKAGSDPDQLYFMNKTASTWANEKGNPSISQLIMDR